MNREGLFQFSDIEGNRITLGECGTLTLRRALNMIGSEGHRDEADALMRRQLEVAEEARDNALAALDRERKAVGEIQRLLLPESLPQIPGFEISSYYRPSERASGDYYDVVPLIDDQWGIVMADVSGHGTPAAVIMAVMRTLIHANLPENKHKSSCEFLEVVNRVMSHTYLRDGRFVTVWCAILDPKSRKLTYASAGHNPPRLLRNGVIHELDAACGFPLGIDSDASYEEVTIPLEPDDMLLIYTDGITEAMRKNNDRRELFGTDRLDQVLMECGTSQSLDCTKRVVQALADFSEGAAPPDDQTMLIFRALSACSGGDAVSQNSIWYDAPTNPL